MLELAIDSEEDQVPRLARFREAHPEVDICNPQAARSQFWKAARDGEIIAIEIDLRRLLDTLERKLGGRP